MNQLGSVLALTVSVFSTSLSAQEIVDYEETGWSFDPNNIQASFDAPLEQLPESGCQSSGRVEPDRSYALAGNNWAQHWRFANDSDIQTAQGLDAIDGYRFLLGTIVDYDQDGVDDYARVVMNDARQSAALVRFADKNREPVLLALGNGLLSGESIKGTRDGCLIVGYPEVGSVTYFMKDGNPMAIYIDHGR